MYVTKVIVIENIWYAQLKYMEKVAYLYVSITKYIRIKC